MPSRNIDDLCPPVAEKCRMLIYRAKENGIDLIITSTVRSHLEQLAYYAQGREPIASVNNRRQQAGLPSIDQKTNKLIITSNLTSIHEFGCAFDVAVAKAGTAIWDIKADTNADNIPDYEEIGVIGEALGLRWGGRFPKKDYVHFEYTGKLTLADLKAGSRPAAA